MSVVTWHRETIGQKTVEALRKNGFDAEYVAGREEAAERALRFVTPGASVGFGGSMTLEQDLGFHARVEARAGTSSASRGTTRARRPSPKPCAAPSPATSSARAPTPSRRRLPGEHRRRGATRGGPHLRSPEDSGPGPASTSGEGRGGGLGAPAEQGGTHEHEALNLPNPCTRTGRCVDCKNDTRAAGSTTC